MNAPQKVGDFYKHKIVDVAKLVPYAANARTHSENQVQQIAASIREFGFTNPILIDEKNNLIAGHGRLLAAHLLELKKVPAIVVNGLSDRRRRALVLADNKLALNAAWDMDMLALELQEIGGDLSELVGFTQGELEDILTSNFEPGGEDDQSDLDHLQPKMTTCPNCGAEYDLRDVEG